MAAVTAAVVAAGATAYAANKQAGAAEDAANATNAATGASVAEQRRQFDLTRSDQLPWLNAGSSALLQIQKLNSGDFSSFYESPDYAFTRDQSLDALDRGAAARGSMFSGGADVDRMQYASGLASQNYGQFYNRLAGLAGIGQTTASGLGSLGMGMASNIGNLHMANAGAQGQAAQQRASAYGQGLAGIAGAFNNWYQNNSKRNKGGTGWYLGNNPGEG